MPRPDGFRRKRLVCMNNKPIIIKEIKEINTALRKKCEIRTKNKYCCVLSCRTEGESLFFYNGETVKIERGDILFIPFGATYSQATDGEKVIYIHIDIFNSNYGGLHIYRARSEREADETVKRFSEIASLWNEKKPNYYYRCMAGIYNIISSCNAIPLCESAETSSILFPAVKYIDENFQNSDFNLNKACENAHISRTYFNKLFKEAYKVTPTEYINKIRLSRAESLLKSGFYTRSEIALLCGFKDVKYFYTFFRKQSGMTTKRYERVCCK